MSKAPFDAIAAVYDEQFTASPTGLLQRRRVWSLMGPLITTLQQKNAGRPLRILELNGGSGLDAVWMARGGHAIWLTDQSTAMLEMAANRSALTGLHHRIRIQTLDLAAPLPQLEAPFDLVFSNFGGVNCLPPERLPVLSPWLHDLLSPNGLLAWVTMGAFCWWESAYFLWKRKTGEAFRRQHKGPVIARLDENTSVPTWYYSAAQLRRSFGQHFTLQLSKPVGFWLPPSYLDPAFRKRPGLLRFLNYLEHNLSPAVTGADHEFVVLKKKRL